MKPAKFHLLRRSVFLSAADFGSLMSPPVRARTVNYWEAGTQQVPSEAAELAFALDRAAETLSQQICHTAHIRPMDVAVYQNVEDMKAGGVNTDDLRHPDVHKAGVARAIRKANASELNPVTVTYHQ